jgi:hypothetical protein
VNEFTQLAYFIIKYIDRFSLNNTVGLGGLKPQVYFVPDKGNVEEASPSIMDRLESDINRMLDNWEKRSIHKLL